MTRRNLVLAITEESGLQQFQVKQIVQKIFEAIVDALVHEGRVELRNFGVFEVRQRKARNGRNPGTGEKVRVPASYTVILKPGKSVEKRINEECRKETADCEVSSRAGKMKKQDTNRGIFNLGDVQERA